MKYLMILLTSLFLMSTASAEDKFKTMTDVCEYYEKEITTAYQDIEEYKAIDERNLEKFRGTGLVMTKKDLETTIKWKETIKDKFKQLKEEAKTYHYLDCSDFRDDK